MPAPQLVRWLAITVALASGAGCSASASQPTAEPGAFETVIAQGVAATLTADVPWPSLLPTSPATAAVSPLPTVLPLATAGPLPTPFVPVSRFFTDARYELSEERLIGGHAIRVWDSQAPGVGLLGVDRIATLAQVGRPPVQVEFFSGLHPLTGSDITGDGTPEVILETYTGGAHCCFSTIVFSLGAEAEKVLETSASNCGGSFEDLNDDGVLEFITCDDRFAYAYCSFAASPVVTVVLSYTPGDGYVPNSPAHAPLYAESIARHTALAEQATPGGLGEWDATTKCAVLPLVLDYLYSGQTSQAWSEFGRLYTFPDAGQFREEIEATLQSSPLYAAPADAAPV